MRGEKSGRIQMLLVGVLLFFGGGLLSFSTASADSSAGVEPYVTCIAKVFKNVTFHFVDTKHSLQAALRGDVPKGSSIYYQVQYL